MNQSQGGLDPPEPETVCQRVYAGTVDLAWPDRYEASSEERNYKDRIQGPQARVYNAKIAEEHRDKRGQYNRAQTVKISHFYPTKSVLKAQLNVTL